MRRAWDGRVKTSPTGCPGVTGRAVTASYAQERMWLISQLAHDGPLYHVADKLVVHARLDEASMRAALDAVVARHEPLRTAFTLTNGLLTAVIFPRVDCTIDFVDLSGEDELCQAERCDAIADGLRYAEFDLGQPPLWRATLIQLADGHWMVPFVAHHAVFDSASLFNLRAELTEICVSAAQGRPPSLPDLPVRYSEYATRQRERLAREAVAPGELVEFWRSQLAGLPAEHGMPLDHPRPARRTFAGADVRTKLPAAVTAGLLATARDSRTTPFMVLLAAYLALVHRRSGYDDVIVGVPVAGRDQPELLPLIGTFVNMVVLRVDTSADPTFAELVGRVRDVCAAAWAHQEMPFQRLVELFADQRRASVPPLYQLGFNLPAPADLGSASSAAEDDLLLEVAGDLVRIEYNTALFDQRTAAGLLDDYAGILAAGLAATRTPLSRLPMTVKPPDRRADGSADSLTRPPHVAPRTQFEALVAQAWSDLLGVAPVGALDGFFELGGHSLQALRMLAQLSARCEVLLTVRAFFADATVAGLAAELEHLSGGRA